ncbi:MAG: sulfur carrier protein ThiS [Aquabacterium sp.]|uniref:sulfur carrier protein ThiS n=1 Tax=Aquabacterium sp. TaxID=1872578 RepID=UPI003BE29AC9
MTPTITIHTDTGPLSLPPQTHLDEALHHILSPKSLTPEQVATAVNGTFVPRHARAQHILQDGDAVLCFAPITGG